MGFVFNPFTGNFDIEGASGGTVVTGYQVDSFTLSLTDITNKYIILNNLPTDVTRVVLLPDGGIPQFGSSNFVVTGDKHLSWNGTALEPIMEQNDKILVAYY